MSDPPMRAMLATLARAVLELAQIEAATCGPQSPLMSPGHWKMRAERLTEIVRILEAMPR